MELKEDMIVLCTVQSIEGATVFLKIEGNGTGSMTMSEVAAGRIRNLREYVTPNKKVVCKVLKIIDGHPHLSLRRVTGREREEIQKRYKKEKSFSSLLKTVSKGYEPILNKIKEKYELWQFIDLIKENPKIIKEFMSEEESKNLINLLKEKEETEREAKETFILKSFSESGLKDIKSVLDIKDAEIKYLGSSKFMISAKAKDFKDANSSLSLMLQEIEKRAKEKKCIFELKDKK